MGVIRHWFSKKCGLALGATTTGSSLGGMIFSTVGQNLLPRVGHVSRGLSICVMFTVDGKKIGCKCIDSDIIDSHSSAFVHRI